MRQAGKGAVPVKHAAAAREYYCRLFARGPEFEPHDDFLEWAPIGGRQCWFHVAGPVDAVPLSNRVRFGVVDLAEAVTFLDAARIAHSAPSQLPGVVAFVDFADPWGNQLGYYHDLVPSGQQRE